MRVIVIERPLYELMRLELGSEYLAVHGIEPAESIAAAHERLESATAAAREQIAALNAQLANQRFARRKAHRGEGMAAMMLRLGAKQEAE